MPLSRSFRPLLAGAALLLAAPAGAQTTLLGNLPPGAAENVSNVGAFTTRAGSFTMGSSSFTLSKVVLRLRYPSFASPVPIVELRSDAGGANPGAAILTGFNNPSFTPDADQSYDFLPQSGVTLQANTKYWLYVHGTENDYFWLRTTTPVDNGVLPTGPHATFGAFRRSSDSGATWSTDDRFHSFEILGSAAGGGGDPDVVPEPGSLLLFLPGLAAVAIRRRRGPSPRE